MLKKCFLVIVLIMIIIPIMFFNYEKDSVSIVDNRMLTELTDFKMNTVNQYINDRIGFREEAIEVYNDLNEKIFNVSTNPQLMMGEEGNLYPKISSIETFNDYHHNLLKTIKRIQNYCEDRDIDFYYMVNPSKTTIMLNELPKGIKYNTNWLNDFVLEAQELGINLVDNYHYFKELESDGYLYNKKYDTYHRNDYGAFLGINNLLKLMNLPVNRLEDFDIERDLDVKNDKVYNFDAKNKPFTYTNKYKDGLIMADDFKEFLYYTQNNNGPKLLSFEGSYLLTNDRTEKFIANHFSETVAVHDYQNIFNINYYLNIFDPAIVLFEMADYTFQEYYFSQYYMETIELQPLLNLEITDIFNQEGRLQYIKEINGEYVNYIIKKPVDCFDYKYLLVGDKIYDLYTYDNENIALTILLKNDININSARVITKKANENFGLAYSLFQ